MSHQDLKEMKNNKCCESEEKKTTVSLFLDNKILWVTVNGVRAAVNLSSLSVPPEDSGSPVELLLPVTSNGQTVFSQVIPENATPTELIVRGVVYTQIAGDFGVDEEDVVWSGPFDLDITDTVVLKLWQL